MLKPGAKPPTAAVMPIGVGVFAICGLLIASGCGQKGDLYRVEPAVVEQPAPAEKSDKANKAVPTS